MYILNNIYTQRQQVVDIYDIGFSQYMYMWSHGSFNTNQCVAQNVCQFKKNLLVSVQIRIYIPQRLKRNNRSG